MDTPQTQPITSVDKIKNLLHPLDAIHRKMDLLLTLGQLLMEHGASTSQIQHDMIRAAAYMGIPSKNISIHLSYTTLMLNINDKTHSYTDFRKTLKHGTNTTTLSILSKLTWKAIENDFTLDEFENRLRNIQKMEPKYPTWVLILGGGLACGAFNLLFGGTILSAWITTFCTIIAFYVRMLCNRWGVNVYISVAIAAFTGTMLAYCSHYFASSIDMLYAMISCSLFMIPGVPLINAVDDMMSNHIVSGVTRAIHTALIVGGIAVGIDMALLFDQTSRFSELSILPTTLYPLQMGAAIVAAAGFAVIFNTPHRLLWIISLGSVIVIFIRNVLLIYCGFTLPGAVLVAAGIISILMMNLAKPLRTASSVLAIPAVIPMIPGVLLYRFLFFMLQINHLNPEQLLHAEQSGVIGILSVVCIAIGVAAPSIFGQRYLERKKESHLQNALSKRRNRLQTYLHQIENAKIQPHT